MIITVLGTAMAAAAAPSSAAAPPSVTLYPSYNQELNVGGPPSIAPRPAGTASLLVLCERVGLAGSVTASGAAAAGSATAAPSGIVFVNLSPREHPA